MQYYFVKGICKYYLEEKILENITFSLKKGEIVSIVGKSGVGKTTLFNILAGFEEPDLGDIYLNEEKINKTKRNVSYMMQKPLLLPHLKVIDNILLPFYLKKSDKKLIYNKVLPIIEEFGLLEHIEKYPNEISGGMKQKVTFLRAYLQKADIMLLDEPFSSLDSITKHYIYEWFKKILDKRENTVIFITHDIEEAIILSDRIIVIGGKPSNILLDLEVSKNKFDSNKDLHELILNRINEE